MSEPTILIHHIGMPSQLFDLADDPEETRDLASDDAGKTVVDRPESVLRGMLGPEATDRQGKCDQQTLAEKYGGEKAIIARGNFPRTPVPNTKFGYLPVAESTDSDAQEGS